MGKHPLEDRFVRGFTRAGMAVRIFVCSVEKEDGAGGFYVYGYRSNTHNPATRMRAGKPNRYHVPLANLPQEMPQEICS